MGDDGLRLGLTRLLRVLSEVARRGGDPYQMLKEHLVQGGDFMPVVVTGLLPTKYQLQLKLTVKE